MSLSFAKLHGLGNDFVVVDLRDAATGAGPDRSAPDGGWFDVPAAISRLCDRHRGVGADGVLALFPPSTQAREAGAVARMRVRNADGSEAEMCGNGLRCVASYLHRHGAAAQLRIETGAGVLACQVARQGDSVRVEMGPARPMGLHETDDASLWSAEHRRERRVSIAGRDLLLTLVSMGNPHAVHFVAPTVDEGELWQQARTLGPLLERHPLFPQRTNVEFVRCAGADRFTVIVWERACGITQACGTGACAVAVAACLRGHAAPGRGLRIDLPGGALDICVQPDFSQVLMTGPVAHIFDGQLPDSLLQ